MKRQSITIRYYFLLLSLCCMQNNIFYGMQSSPYARLYTILQDKRTWAATAAFLFVGSAVWYLWWKSKPPTIKITATFKELSLPQEFDSGVVETITTTQVNKCFREHQDAVKLINSFLSSVPTFELDQYVHRIVIILSKQDPTLMSALQEWFAQFKEIFPSNQAKIQALIECIIKMKPKQSSLASSSATTTTITSLSPDVPKAGPSSHNLVYNRGITYAQVQQIFTKHNGMIASIDAVLKKQNKPTLSDKMQNIHLILNQGDKVLKGKLVVWLNRFQGGVQVEPLIKDLMNLQGTTALMPFPAVPQKVAAAPGQSSEYTTTRGFSENEVGKILDASNVAVGLIDELLSERSITTLSAHAKDIHKILNHGDGTQISELSKWLNQFKAFFQEPQQQDLKRLIEDLTKLEKPQT